jgi:hypothetical protein
MRGFIPYFDTDRTLLNWLTVAKAEEYYAAGTTRAVRSKKGQLRCLYLIPRGDGFATAAGAISSMSSAASQTVQRVRNDGGVVIAGPTTKEHRALGRGAVAVIEKERQGLKATFRPDSGGSVLRHLYIEPPTRQARATLPEKSNSAEYLIPLLSSASDESAQVAALVRSRRASTGGD